MPRGASAVSGQGRQGLAVALEGWAPRMRFRWPEWSALSVYAALVACAIPFHEPWRDEAQSWQLARSLSLPSLFRTYLGYEATPGLWHFLLWIVIHAHVGYTGLHWICGAIGVGTTALLVFRSPFPLYLRLTLPFTYFLLFQYVVVARSYVLVPLLLYLIALCWKKSPLLLAVLLGLLANVELHAAVISGGLALVYAMRCRWPGSFAERFSWRERRNGLVLLAGLYAFAVWTAWPPHDLSFVNTASPLPIEILMRLFNLSRPWALPIAFWIAVAVCLRARGAAVYLLPVLLFAAFGLAVHTMLWHTGLLFPLALCLLWITWPGANTKPTRGEGWGRGALLAMAGLQILWSAYALQFDHFHTYSPALATANFLKPYVQVGDRIAVSCLGQARCQDYEDVGVLPYFDHNIYVNQQEAFWWWSKRNRTEDAFYALLPSRPRVVIVQVDVQPDGTVNLKDKKVDLLVDAGYLLSNQFCGATADGFHLDLRTCNLIFLHRDGSK